MNLNYASLNDGSEQWDNRVMWERCSDASSYRAVMLDRGTPVNESVELISEEISISCPEDSESSNRDNQAMRERCGDAANYRMVMLERETLDSLQDDKSTPEKSN
jgi:hypothetical protein